METKQTDVYEKVEQAFYERLKEENIAYSDENIEGVIFDGEIHRFNVEGEDHENGWYQFKNDGASIYGNFGSHKNHDEDSPWPYFEYTFSESNVLTEDALERRRKLKSEQHATTKVKHNEARKKAQEIFSTAAPLNIHKYLTKKGFTKAQVEKVASATSARLINFPKSGLLGTLLCIPYYSVDKTLQTLQFIDEEGEKRFLKHGQKRGHYNRIQGKNDALYFCEGFSTGLSVHLATGNSVVVCGDKNNVMPVMQSLREKVPKAKFILAADNDAMDSARKIANQVDAQLVTPECSGTDFNDLMQEYGLNEVKAQLNVTAKRWPQPLALEADDLQLEPFPIDELPSLAREAVKEYHRFGKQPLPLIASSVLSAMSLATQGLADVARNNNLVGPCSIFLLVVAHSGERKSACDKTFTHVFYDWMSEKNEEWQEQIMVSKAASIQWSEEIQGLKNRIRKFAESPPKPDSNEPTRAELGEALSEKLMSRPERIVGPDLFYSDVTQEGLKKSLATGWPSGALWSAEAAAIVGGHGMSESSMFRFLALLNELWDGQKDFSTHRSTSDNFKLPEIRFTTNLMMQPLVFKELLTGKNGAGRGLGFLARFLITKPTSTMGQRIISFGELDTKLEAVKLFNQKIYSILNTDLLRDDKGKLSPKVIKLSPEAYKVWVTYFNATENELKPFGKYVEVSDFTSKTAENAARLAGLFHVFEHGLQGDISADTMKAAAKVSFWFLGEAKMIISNSEASADLEDAKLLAVWLKEKRIFSIPFRKLQQDGPRRLRTKVRLTRTIKILEDSDLVELVEKPKKTLNVNPHYLDNTHGIV